VGNPAVHYRITDSGQSLVKSIDTVLEVLDLEDASWLK
jgi:hypothetical protein